MSGKATQATSEASPFTPRCLHHKVALVTGGTSGIGYEIASCLGAHGCKVVVTGRRHDVLEAAAEQLRAAGIDAAGLQGDVRKRDDCERWAARAAELFGGLHILVNCAAGALFFQVQRGACNFLAPAEELSVNGFRTVMEIDAVGTFNMSRAAFPPLAACKDGRIINISATLHYGATWYQIHASAAKAAIDSMTRTLALEWGHYGIKVTGVAPGPIKGTAGMSKLAPGASEDEVAAEISNNSPVGRMGNKSDIALACVYLSSSAGSYVSGHVLVVDGAAWMWREPAIPREAVSKASRGVEAQSRAVGTARSKM